VGCNQEAGENCTPVGFQHPLIRLRFLLFFVKYLFWFGALLLVRNEGRVLSSYGIFQTSCVKSALKRRTRKIEQKEKKVPRLGSIRGGVLYIVKSYCIVFSNIKSPKCLWSPPIRETEPVVILKAAKPREPCRESELDKREKVREARYSIIHYAYSCDTAVFDLLVSSMIYDHDHRDHKS
jgi:hypothetical protein